MRALTLSAAAAVLLATSSLPASQATLMRFKWTPGEATRYRLTQQTDVSMSGLPGVGDMTLGTTMVQNQTLTVESVGADGTATIRARFDSVRMDMATPMGNVSYDSANPNAPSDPMLGAIASSLGAVVGESVTIVMTSTGAVQKVEGMSRILQKTTQAVGGGIPGMPGPEAMLSDDGMKATFQQNFSFVPERAVAPNDSWKSQLTLNLPTGALVASSAYTLKSIDRVDGRDLARIAYVTQIKPAGTGPSALGPVAVQMGEGNGQGETLWDVARGRLHNTSGTSVQPMNMTMTGPDGSSLAMQASTKTTTTLEVVVK
jgi:hypothetical protein